jgi:hypothetical protein
VAPPRSPPFKEDFFERVINVAWEDEPKVYWMAATGYPLIVNGLLYGDLNAWIFTSDDGQHWIGQGYGHHAGGAPDSEWGFGAFWNGGWMRTNLEKGADPVWVLVGSDGKLTGSSIAGASTDGLVLTSTQTFDPRHSMDDFIRDSEYPGCLSYSGFNFPNWHLDPVRSHDGRAWVPAHYHDDSASSEAAAFAVPTTFAAQPTSPTSVVARVTHPPGPRPALMSATPALALPAPKAFATASSSSEEERGSKADNLVFIASGHFASGKVKKGKYAKKNVSMYIDPYYPYDGFDGSHGGPRIVAYIEKEFPTEPDIEPLVMSCGIARTVCLNYGHYVFVVGGSSGSGEANQNSTIAYTDDLENWKLIELGLHAQVNVLAVGPRPKGAPDIDHSNDPETPDGEPPVETPPLPSS